jgi:hypothetical protein
MVARMPVLTQKILFSEALAWLFWHSVDACAKVLLQCSSAIGRAAVAVGGSTFILASSAAAHVRQEVLVLLFLQVGCKALAIASQIRAAILIAQVV